MGQANLIKWKEICGVEDAPHNGGVAVLIDGVQLAVFHFSATNEWFATQNRCPHWGEQVLSRGLIGDSNGEPKVACPMHKRTFSLRTGRDMDDEKRECLTTIPVKVHKGRVYVAAPPKELSHLEQEHRAKNIELINRTGSSRNIEPSAVASPG